MNASVEPSAATGSGPKAAPVLAVKNIEVIYDHVILVLPFACHIAGGSSRWASIATPQMIRHGLATGSRHPAVSSGAGG
jgi:hypothetical protein